MRLLRSCFLVAGLFARADGLAQGLQPELPGIDVVVSRVGGVPVFALRNPQLAEMTVSLEFTLDNLTSSVPVPFQAVLAPNYATPPLLALRPIDPKKPWHYTYSSYFSWGSPLALHTTNQIYRLPFAAGRSFRVIQGHDGGFSHTGENRFAIDFGMPEGTPVLAARRGLVVLVRDGFDIGAPDPAYKKRANLVFVRHSDGTIGEYLHLLRGGIKVRTGDTVRAGQLLALSGNSGYTRGPHLHFMVFRAKDSKVRESLPIRFATEEGSDLVLEEGKSYTAAAFRQGPESGPADAPISAESSSGH
jgi:murein DD-endopeptidase MepM/ murein hydrolase activator NlpD